MNALNSLEGKFLFMLNYFADKMKVSILGYNVKRLREFRDNNLLWRKIVDGSPTNKISKLKH